MNRSIAQSLKRRSPLRSARLKEFARDQDAVAAVEFALILPFLLLLLFGSIDLTDGVTARRKITLAASTVSDLVAQAMKVDASYMNNAFLSESAVMTPYDTSTMTTIISSVTVDANGQPKVVWSLAKNTTARSKNTDFPLPDTLKVAGKNLIVAEVTYKYKPVVGHAFTGTFDMKETSYAQPRLTETGVECTAPGC